jgi:hypothetical protein
MWQRVADLEGAVEEAVVRTSNFLPFHLHVHIRAFHPEQSFWIESCHGTMSCGCTPVPCFLPAKWGYRRTLASRCPIMTQNISQLVPLVHASVFHGAAMAHPSQAWLCLQLRKENLCVLATAYIK